MQFFFNYDEVPFLISFEDLKSSFEIVDCLNNFLLNLLILKLFDLEIFRVLLLPLFSSRFFSAKYNSFNLSFSYFKSRDLF